MMAQKWRTAILSNLEKHEFQRITRCSPPEKTLGQEPRCKGGSKTKCRPQNHGCGQQDQSSEHPLVGCPIPATGCCSCRLVLRCFGHHLKRRSIDERCVGNIVHVWSDQNAWKVKSEQPRSSKDEKSREDTYEKPMNSSSDGSFVMRFRSCHSSNSCSSLSSMTMATSDCRPPVAASRPRHSTQKW